MDTPEKRTEKPQTNWDMRKISWTNDKADELWKRMMRGGKDLTQQVRYPFTPQNPKKE